MRKLLIAIIITLAMVTPSFADSQSDYDLAKAWMNKHAKGGHITCLNTTAKGGYWGKVKGKNRGVVRYTKKVKKGKKVKVYLVFKKGEDECSAFVCLGKVK